jgi:hypothetical protein
MTQSVEYVNVNFVAGVPDVCTAGGALGVPRRATATLMQPVNDVTYSAARWATGNLFAKGAWVDAGQ